jgi:hypothetical protein
VRGIHIKEIWKQKTERRKIWTNHVDRMGRKTFPRILWKWSCKLRVGGDTRIGWKEDCDAGRQFL